MALIDLVTKRTLAQQIAWSERTPQAPRYVYLCKLRGRNPLAEDFVQLQLWECGEELQLEVFSRIANAYEVSLLPKNAPVWAFLTGREGYKDIEATQAQLRYLKHVIDKARTGDALNTAEAILKAI